MFDVKPITSPLPSDCGATCMKMLLAYYGQDVDLDQLIKDCNTTIRGCSGRDLLRAGRKYGLDMTAWKEIDAKGDVPEGAKVIDVDILEQDRPAIIWWKYNHWCLFCGMDDKGKVVICNPDLGRYRMDPGTFRAFYSKVSLCNGEPHGL